MLCPTCKKDECAEGRVLCWCCLETALDRVKVTCEGRSKVSVYIPYDPNPSPYRTAIRKQNYRVHRRGM